MMPRFPFLLLLAAHAVNVVLAAPHNGEPTSTICPGFQWGVTMEKLISEPMTVYNQYVQTTACGGPAWVQSSTEPTPPTSISPWGTTYLCQVPKDMYFCGAVQVVTCCGNITTSATV